MNTCPVPNSSQTLPSESPLSPLILFHPRDAAEEKDATPAIPAPPDKSPLRPEPNPIDVLNSAARSYTVRVRQLLAVRGPRSKATRAVCNGLLDESDLLLEAAHCLESCSHGLLSLPRAPRTGARILTH
ncbi:MAG TPA: hypothetical protein VGF73_08895 [Chthoniobacterales bacterium]|jgi:hypothetical protein